MTLAVPLLAALLLHGLLLAAAGLRPVRPAAAPLQRADDTPELLVFSRLPPEPLPGDAVPLPPPELLPAPPPPPLPSRSLRPRKDRRAPTASAGGRRDISVRAARAGRRTGPRAPARASLAAAVPKSSPQPGSGARGGAGAAATAGGAGTPPAASPPPSLPLAGGGSASPEQLRRWRLLWQGAEAGAALPPPPGGLVAALALAPPPVELRRLPLQRARQEGLEPSSGQLVRLDGQRLLLWIEGPDLWVLRAPA